jgi:hypothetical protein
VEVEKVAVPYVRAHLDAFEPARGGRAEGLTASA